MRAESLDSWQLCYWPAIQSLSTSPIRAEDEIPPPLKKYHGRRIATTMHYLGAPWLTRESRDREEDCETLLAALEDQAGPDDLRHGLRQRLLHAAAGQARRREGQGASPSTFSARCSACSRTARPTRRSATSSRSSARSIDPQAGPESVDLVLLVDVYHEFSHPEQMLRAIRSSLKPNGRVALVEFRAEDPNVPIKPLHKMSKEQILKEFEPNGFKLVEEFDKLPWQHLMFFERDDARANRQVD